MPDAIPYPREKLIEVARKIRERREAMRKTRRVVHLPRPKAPRTPRG